MNSKNSMWLTEGGTVLAWLRVSTLTLLVIGWALTLALALR